MNDLIRAIPDFSGKTVAQLVEALNAKSVAVRSTENVRYATIEKAYGLAVMIQVRGAIRALLASGQLSASVFEILDYSNTRLNSDEGMDLSSDTAQQQMEGLRAIPQLAPFVTQIKELGVAHKSPWEHAGNTGLVTDNQVQSALTAIRKEDLIEAKRTEFEQWRVEINEWDGNGDPPLMGA